MNAEVVPDRSRRVVVADNDQAALDLVCLDLEFEGHQILARCLDGQMLLDAVARLEPDVVITDYRMPPGPSGLDVARALHERGDTAAVIVYSNYQDPTVVAGVRAAGARFLPKGDLHRLRQVVLDV